MRAMGNPEAFRNKKIIIYGTGYVAHMFHRVLRMYHLQDNIQCCVTTSNSGEKVFFEGIPVYGIHGVCMDEQTVVCLAVHESVKDEIEHTVKKMTSQYVWVYPRLYEWMLGEPLHRNVEISVGRLLEGYRKDLRLAVRLAAIEQHEGKNGYGFRYYINAQMLHCGIDTAGMRLEQFKGLLEDWKQFGYRRQFPVTVNSSYEVIDGDHRMAVAAYLGQESICCDIYPDRLTVQEIHENGAMMSGETLARHGFTKKDLDILEGIQRRYMDTYGTT